MASETPTQQPPAGRHPAPARQPADPSGVNLHGSITEKYLNQTVADVQDVVSIDLGALKPPPATVLLNTDGSEAAVAVAVAYKNATQPDPATGARAIKPDAVDDLKLALRSYAVDALGIGHAAPSGQETGLTTEDVAKAVDQAVTAAAADPAQAALSLSLTAAHSQRSHSKHPMSQGTTQTDAKATLSLTVNGDGVLTGKVDRHTTQRAEGVVAVEGSAAAPLPQHVGDPLYKSYDRDAYAFAPANELNKEPPGVQATRTVAVSYVQGDTNTHIAPVTGVKTEVTTARSGSAHQTLRFDENGTTVLEAGSSEDSSTAPRANGAP